MAELTADAILARLRDRMPDGSSLQIPPPVFQDMEGELLSYDPDAQVLRARFPVLERYQNPLGTMQGGILVALVDNTLGPLSYLAAPPSVTTQLNTTFIRPVTAKDTYVEVEGRVTEQAGRQLFMTARVTNAQGKTLALSQATCQILRRAR
jgi:uncharacterized protein (TIGR00369 family)